MRVSKIALLVLGFALLIPTLARAVSSCESLCASPYLEDQAYCSEYCGDENTGFMYTYYAFSEGVCTLDVVGYFGVSCDGSTYSWGQGTPCSRYEPWTLCESVPIDPGPVTHEEACARDHSAFGCIRPGCVDDTLLATDCCSGIALPGSTTCVYPSDWGTSWASCTQICG